MRGEGFTTVSKNRRIECLSCPVLEDLILSQNEKIFVSTGTRTIEQM